ncbi:MAG TPA: Hsp20/alpha crystallin family protein [Candidatus Saccharimonadales bacterium]|nr:Hsp20/alpha crystallin family protein [Candidatus Saccharimonadales bacterium]
MLDLIRSPSSSLGLSTFEEFDRLLDNFWKTSNLPTTGFGLPSVDIYSEDDKHMVVEMQAPGFSEDDIQINVRNDVLEIRGETTNTSEQKDKKRNYLMRESRASFARRVVLPEGADTDNISAELDKGVLKVTVPVQRPEAKRIQITSGSGNKAKRLTANKS